MKWNFNRRITGIIAVLAITGAIICLNYPAKLPHIDSQQSVCSTKAKIESSATASAAANSPTANLSAFKNQGQLAFVWNGLLYNLDGKNGTVRQLTQSGTVINPSWSHDGNYLAFIRMTDFQNLSGSLWIADKKGEQVYQVQGLPGAVNCDDFHWSPTSDRLVVGIHSTPEGTNSNRDSLWLVPVTGKPDFLAGVDWLRGFAWSPDGKTLAYNVTLHNNQPEIRNDALYTISVDKSKQNKYVEEPDTAVDVAGWWPDGQGILYWLDPGYGCSTYADGLELMSLPLGNSSPQKLGISLAAGAEYPNWLSISPQGRVLMVAGSGREIWKDKSLVVADLTKGAVQQLKNPAGYVALDPALSADDKHIVFVAAKDLNAVYPDNEKDFDAWINTRTLWICNLDGSDMHELPTAGTGVFLPSWSHDSQSILYIQDNSIWMINCNGGKPVKVLGPFPQDISYPYSQFTTWFQG